MKKQEIKKLSKDETLKNTLNVRCAGICSDWVQKIKVMRA